MSGKLAQEIRQSKPFALREEEAFLNLGRTWEHLQSHLADLLKSHQLTPTQYNMLRILRGAGKSGLNCSEASDRMITQESDITRLLDRMEARGMIERERSKEDRRIVRARITAEGQELVGKLDVPIRAFMQSHLGSIGQKKLADLIQMLETLRERPA